MSDTPPFLKVYPRKWRDNLAIQSLSFHTRGVWIELLCIMHGSPQRGKLIGPDGTAITEDMIARLLGLSMQETSKALKELIASKIAATCPSTKALMDTAMVREEYLKKVRASGGFLGGNPTLTKVNLEGYPYIQPSGQPSANLNGKVGSPNPPPNAVPGTSCTESGKEDKRKGMDRGGTGEEGKGGEKGENHAPLETLTLVVNLLQSNPVYAKLDVAREAGKAQMWCETHHRHFTKRFFINWLNRAEIPINGTAISDKRPLSICDLKSVIQAKEAKATELKRRFCSEVATGDQWSDQGKRSEFYTIRREIKTINERISKAI